MRSDNSEIYRASISTALFMEDLAWSRLRLRPYLLLLHILIPMTISLG